MKPVDAFKDKVDMLEYYGHFDNCVWTVEILDQCVDMQFEVLRMFL